MLSEISNYAYPGWYSFDGAKLAQARMSATDELSTIHCPAIYESSVEEYGLFRIEWNYKYLNSRKE